MTETTAPEENPLPEDAPEVEPAAASPAYLEAEIARLKDQLLRALAEQENVRRRAQRDKEDAVKFAASNFAKDLLAPADNLRRAIESVPENLPHDQTVRNLLAGVEATERELLTAFERHGIKRIEAQGERFDHNLHQAIFEVEDSGKPAGTVVQVLQPGYLLADRLLRPAMVGVAKGTPAPAEAPPSEPIRRVDRTA